MKTIRRVLNIRVWDRIRLRVNTQAYQPVRQQVLFQTSPAMEAHTLQQLNSRLSPIPLDAKRLLRTQATRDLL